MTKRPEILAPAGDRDALAAALAAGADAVYFGLDDGFNARARAENFPSTGLAEVVAWVHRNNARVYITVNTLVFEPELAIVEVLLRRIAASGADAIIVQDPAIARIAHALCPDLEIHASTQMTASSPAAVELLRDLHLSRVVVPRELSVDEIRLYAEGSPVPLEVFIHGALCVAWSGQCLSSEVWGGRSANRGQCAQACRLPYQLVVDGTTRDLGEVEYLLSPKDLVGLDAVPALADIGVASLKIEGRLKGPGYVATTVARYRDAVARAAGHGAVEPAVEIPIDDASLHVAYSRGISRGFLGGSDHQTLVEGRFPRHRGLPLGRVSSIERDAVVVLRDASQRPVTGGRALDSTRAIGDSTRAIGDSARAIGDSARAIGDSTREGTPPPSSPDLEPRAGMGVVFDAGHPEADETGGPIFAVEPMRGGYRLRFGNPGPDLSRVSSGDFVWVSSDPRVSRAGEKAAEAGREQLGRIPVSLVVTGVAGEPLHVVATAHTRGRTFVATAATSSTLEPARGAGLSPAVLADKLGGFGGTPFHLASSEELAHVAGDRAVVVAGTGTPSHADAGVQPADASASTRADADAPSRTDAGVQPADASASTRADADAPSRADAGVHPADSSASTRAGAVHAGSDLAPPSNAGDAAPPSNAGDAAPPSNAGDAAPPSNAGARPYLPVDASRMAAGLHVPVSELKDVRRRLAVSLDHEVTRVTRVVAWESVLDELRPGASDDGRRASSGERAPIVVPLCRDDDQLDAVLEAGATEVELDWMELVGLAKAVSRARARGARVVVATTRIQKPGEDKIDQHLARLEPDAVLVRSWGSLATHTKLATGATLHGDFSLNVTNSITAAWVLGHGLDTITAAHDLDREQLLALLAAAPRGRVAVTIHHHVPTFHTEHCVYAHLLSTGRDYKTCGRPCERHAVALADRVGMVHPVVVDVGCRNTVFNAQAQSAASLVPELLGRGVWRLRVELVRETAAEARRVFEAYRGLVAGTAMPADVLRTTSVHEQFGVTRGTMRTLTVLR